MAEKKQAAGEGEEAPAKGSKKKMLLIGGGAGLVLLLAGVLAFVFFGGKDEHAEEEAARAAEHAAPALYATLGQKFVVTLQGEGKPHYFQVALSVMAREQTVIDELGVHAPLVRDRVGGLLAKQDFERMRTEEGKLALQAEVLAKVQEILQTETGKPGVEQVYFTEFVLQ